MEGEPGEQRRWVPATGVVNARDLGGLPIVGGGSTSFGQLFRSARLSELDAAGRTAIEALDLVEIIDLRRNDERAAHPGPYSTAHLGLVGQPSLFDADVASLRTRADGERWLLDDYLGMLTTGAGQVGAIVRRIAHAGGPVLFHCTGGKDRTGIVAAIVLSAVGVQREVVLDDFELTNRRRGPEHLPDVVAAFVEHGIGREAAAALLRASRPLMATALEVVDEQHGSIGRYLTEACGLDDADLAALTGRLVEAPGPVIG